MKTTKIILTSTALLLTIISFSQSDYRQGYIILNNNDTLFGFIDYQKDNLMATGCDFKSTDLKTNTVYLPGEISGYRFIDNKFFQTKNINGKMVFLEVLIKGKLNVYYMQNENYGSQYFIEKQDKKLIELPYLEETRMNENQVSYLYTSKTHIGLLTYYTFDAPQLKPRINELGKPEHENLIALAKAYHNMVCSSESCTTYEKKKVPIKIGIEISAGALKFSSLITSSKNYYLNSSFLFKFLLSQQNERLYFKTGFQYARPEIKKDEVSWLKIPIHFEYRLPYKYICPSVSFGPNIYKTNFGLHASLGFTLGIYIKLDKLMYLSLYSDTDFSAKFSGWQSSSFMACLCTQFFSDKIAFINIVKNI